MIQTYSPDEFCIVSAQKQDYEAFYQSEIIMREKLNYPPFCDIIIGMVCGENESITRDATNQFYDILSKHFHVYKPVPAPIAKINKEFRYRVLMKEKIDEEKNQLLGECIKQFEAKKLPVRLSVDINPNSMI